MTPSKLISSEIKHLLLPREIITYFNIINKKKYFLF